jgi:uncharacterized protein YjbI with pentapeptide repeats
MNEEAGESRTPESEESSLRKITEEKLKGILEQHRKWVESEGKEGKQADLSEANLRGANLQRAELRRAMLQGADLVGTNLKGALLMMANLEGAKLRRAMLQGADLYEANLQRAELRSAMLEGANLTKADLRETDLEGAKLRRAKLQRADLSGSNLRGADLYRAQLEKATLLDANLREAILRNATLEDVSGLLAPQLAGADVSGAKLPPDIHGFESLTVVEEASKNTRKIFLAMLLGCAYSALTVFSTKDAPLLTNSASSPLPIIGTAIPIAGFFGVAPVILFAIYLYFQFYLLRLWQALADLPAVFPDGRPLDKRVYPWLLNGLVRSHFVRLKKGRLPLSRLQALVSILLAWWVVPFTIALFWLRYLPRHEWTGTGFHMTFLVLAIVNAVWFQRLAKITLRGQLSEPIWYMSWRPVESHKEVIKWSYKHVAIGVVVLLVVFGVSDGAINGTPPSWQTTEPNGGQRLLRKIIPQVLPYVGARAFAKISEQEVSTKPPNWFRDGELSRLVKGAQLEHADLRYANAVGAFLVNANLMWANLQGADLRRANLQAADLRRANLQAADLRRANLQAADLADANLQAASLIATNLQAANLIRANLREAFLGGANLQGAELGGANLEGAYLVGATLTTSQVKTAVNWESAFYSHDLLTELGLPADHNQMVCIRLAITSVWCSFRFEPR